MSARSHSRMDSPIGSLLLLATAGRLSGLYMVDHKGGGPAADQIGERDDGAFRSVREQLAAYFAGKLRVFDLQAMGHGTAFQQRVWQALCEIPYGQTLSYGELARRIGQPSASRAVGLANGRNPISIIVPCHRVIGARSRHGATKCGCGRDRTDPLPYPLRCAQTPCRWAGALIGYGGGIEAKRWLLAHEAVGGALPRRLFAEPPRA